MIASNELRPETRARVLGTAGWLRAGCFFLVALVAVSITPIQRAADKVETEWSKLGVAAAAEGKPGRYPGVYDAKGNYRTLECSVFERAVAREYHRRLFAAPDQTEQDAARHAKQVGKKHGVSAQTVKDIYFKALSKCQPLQWMN